MFHSDENGFIEKSISHKTVEKANLLQGALHEWKWQAKAKDLATLGRMESERMVVLVQFAYLPKPPRLPPAELLLTKHAFKYIPTVLERKAVAILSRKG